jgi:EAL domain-containing protein (putative c-di-GMP-specific phosphodiesterase class I)
VPNIARSNNDRAFVHTLIDLSHRLGVKSVAERVQDEETAALLNGRACDYLQSELIGLATSERTWQVEKEQAVSG